MDGRQLSDARRQLLRGQLAQVLLDGWPQVVGGFDDVYLFAAESNCAASRRLDAHLLATE